MDFFVSHKRNFSNNYEPAHSLKSHKRSTSSIKFTGEPLPIHFLKNPEFIPLDSLNSPEKLTNKPKSQSFFGCLDSYSTYFTQIFNEPEVMFYDDVKSLKLQIEELQSVKQNLEQSNCVLESQCETLESSLKTQINSKKEFDTSLAALNQYMQGLEKALIKVSNDLIQQKKESDTLFDEICKTKQMSLKKKKKGSNSGKIVEQPKPQPIYYKPLSQRCLRGSRDSSFSAGIKK